ncbi:MAG: DNA-3-methyladenine glycosylase I [Chloroflexi bacterium]|nr:MAG: DNA-3-methyladenine glycosylase I [Chloroflexota bacterium]
MPDMQAPDQVVPRALGDYLDVMSKAAFQAGISWKVVESKWPGTREAFHNFDIEAVASMSPPEIDELVVDTRVIRNRKKLEAVVSNAEKLIDLQAKHGSFQTYLRSFPDFETLVKNLRKEFNFLGNMGAYYFLHVIGEEVPSHEQWMRSGK